MHRWHKSPADAPLPAAAKPPDGPGKGFIGSMKIVGSHYDVKPDFEARLCPNWGRNPHPNPIIGHFQRGTIHHAAGLLPPLTGRRGSCMHNIWHLYLCPTDALTTDSWDRLWDGVSLSWPEEGGRTTPFPRAGPLSDRGVGIVGGGGELPNWTWCTQNKPDVQ